jgi:peptidylprolyl isomerase
MQRRLFAPLLLVLALGATGCLKSTGPSPIAIEDEKFDSGLKVDLAQMTKTPSGLYYQDLTVGEGATAAAGDSIAVHYTGWLTNGHRFDSSAGFPPIEFKLGAKRVIAGWDEGLQGMRVGGKRKLVIHSDLAYGPYSFRDIPAYANLVFDVELVSVYGAKAE